MTMTRETKAQHNYQLWSARTYGTTTTCFASPQYRQMCREQGRKYFMTATEYVEHRMPARRHRPADEVRERWITERIRRRRRRGTVRRPVSPVKP